MRNYYVIAVMMDDENLMGISFPSMPLRSTRQIGSIMDKVVIFQFIKFLHEFLDSSSTFLTI